MQFLFVDPRTLHIKWALFRVPFQAYATKSSSVEIKSTSNLMCALVLAIRANNKRQ